MEHFDLSLALLAIELCWPLEYVANFKLNEGRHFDVAKKNYHTELIRVINYPDFMLYDHFNATFWARVERVGLETVQEMAEKIRVYSKELADECIGGYKDVKSWNGKMIKGLNSHNIMLGCHGPVAFRLASSHEKNSFFSDLSSYDVLSQYY